MSRAVSRAQGFTLIELLIAIAILAVLAVLGYRGVASLTDTESRLSQEAAQWRMLDQFFSRIEGDLRQALPRPVRMGDSTESAWVGTVDSDGNSVLRLTRAGPEFALEPGSAGQRIAYRLRERQVEVLYWPALDNVATTTPQAYGIAADVVGMTLAYLDTRGNWQSQWPVPNDAQLPRAVRIALRLANGARLERLFALQ
jgi:general secretion pathway protein J